MKQLVIASTFFQCLSLVAAVDAGALPAADEQILVLADGSQAPELTVPLAELEGFSVVASRFDRVVDFGALLYPRRPVQFAPRLEEHPMWERLLRSHWGLGDGPVQVLMDFVQVNPAFSLAGLFAEAELWTHSDGLMTYSPTRRELPLRITQRLRGLIHLDLVPGLRPQMLTEHGGEQRPVPLPALWAVLDEVLAGTDTRVEPDGSPTALVLGQYLASLGLLSAEEELELNRSMIVAAARLGAEVCVFKPHPAAPPLRSVELVRAAATLGIELIIDASPEVAELTMRRRKPHWVLSCFSTGLSTARYLLGLEVVAVGTATLLPRLTPYENSNRIPLVLAEALFARSDFAAPAAAGEVPPSRDLQRLVEAVAYCMQPVLHPELAAPTADYLRLLHAEPATRKLFFPARRLAQLGLPGAPAPVGRLQRGRRWIRRQRRRCGRLLRSS